MGLIGLLVIFLAGIYSFYCFDRILEIEHSDYHAEWRKDGSPIGFFWVPKGSKIVIGSIHRKSRIFRWAFKKPDWAANDQAALRYLVKLRISGAAVLAVSVMMTINILL